jgi:hypothetical protein
MFGCDIKAMIEWMENRGCIWSAMVLEGEKQWWAK